MNSKGRPLARYLSRSRDLCHTCHLNNVSIRCTGAGVLVVFLRRTPESPPWLPIQSWRVDRWCLPCVSAHFKLVKHIGKRRGCKRVWWWHCRTILPSYVVGPIKPVNRCKSRAPFIICRISASLVRVYVCMCVVLWGSGDACAVVLMQSLLAQHTSTSQRERSPLLELHAASC